MFGVTYIFLISTLVILTRSHISWQSHTSFSGLGSGYLLMIVIKKKISSMEGFTQESRPCWFLWYVWYGRALEVIILWYLLYLEFWRSQCCYWRTSSGMKTCWNLYSLVFHLPTGLIPFIYIYIFCVPVCFMVLNVLKMVKNVYFQKWPSNYPPFNGKWIKGSWEVNTPALKSKS